jgi:nuclear transport factor 2 (NTF2) superfamily protein
MTEARPPLPPFTAPERGLMRRREASINDVPITEAERKFRWPRT